MPRQHLCCGFISNYNKPIYKININNKYVTLEFSTKVKNILTLCDIKNWLFETFYQSTGSAMAKGEK